MEGLTFFFKETHEKLYALFCLELLGTKLVGRLLFARLHDINQKINDNSNFTMTFILLLFKKISFLLILFRCLKCEPKGLSGNFIDRKSILDCTFNKKVIFLSSQ